MELLRVALLGGALGLDGTGVGQFMLSRPLVAGVLTGWLLGVPALGATVGVILEVYLLVAFATGGARFPEGSTATVVAVAAASTGAGPGAIALGAAFGLVWGQVAGASVAGQRRLNARLLPRPESPRPLAGTLGRGVLAALAVDFLRGGLLTAAGAGVGGVLVSYASARWPLGAGEGLAVLWVGGAVSFGILLHDLGGFRRRRVLFTVGLALGLLGGALL